MQELLLLLDESTVMRGELVTHIVVLLLRHCLKAL